MYAAETLIVLLTETLGMRRRLRMVHPSSLFLNIDNEEAAYSGSTRKQQ